MNPSLFEVSAFLGKLVTVSYSTVDDESGTITGILVGIRGVPGSEDLVFVTEETDQFMAINRSDISLISPAFA